MEEAEIEHIRKHWVKLIADTDCHVGLLNILFQEKILSSEDIEQLNLPILSKSEKVSLFYKIIQTRTGSYDVLMNALRETDQTGALDILQQYCKCKKASPEVEVKTIKHYDKLPAKLEEILLEKKPKAIYLLSSIKPSITCLKLQENFMEAAIVHEFEDFLKYIPSLDANSTSTNKIHVLSGIPLENLEALLNTCYDRTRKAIKFKLVIITNESEDELRNFFKNCISWKGTVKKKKKIQSNGIGISASSLSIPWPQKRFIEIREDNMEWGDLSHAFKQEIKERLMKSVVGASLRQLNQSQLQTMLREQVLVDLIEERELTLFKNAVPEVPSYYINRKLVTRMILNEKRLFSDDSTAADDDIFCFKGIDRADLSIYVGKKTTGSSKAQLDRKEINQKFIKLDIDSHFEEICRLSSASAHSLKKNVHLIEFKEGKFMLIKSNGKLNDLQRMVQNDKLQDQLSENEFIQNLIDHSCSNQPICISDSPGMGKSLLLAKLGSKVKELYPQRIVLFVELSKLRDELAPQNISRTLPVSLESALRSLCCKNGLEEEMVSHKLKSNELEFELLLDGLDEFDSSEFRLASEMLEALKTFKSIRIWVTTQPHLLHKVENQLGSFGYNILPFNEAEQRKFLTSFWSSRYHDEQQPSLNQQKLNDFSKVCLDSLNLKMGSIEQDIAGIPLQCYLLGEVYERDAVEAATTLTSTSSKKEEANYFQVGINSVAELYQGLIKKKLEIYIVEKSFTTKPKIKEETIYMSHAQFAIELLFPTYFLKLNKSFKKHPFLIEDILKFGILEKSKLTGTVQFIHRTFAEYFVAEFISRKINNGSGAWRNESFSWRF